jgi:hypothetical protein
MSIYPTVSFPFSSYGMVNRSSLIYPPLSPFSRPRKDSTVLWERCVAEDILQGQIRSDCRGCGQFDLCNFHSAGTIRARRANPRAERLVSSAAACCAVLPPRDYCETLRLFPVGWSSSLLTHLALYLAAFVFWNGNSTATTFVSRELESNGAGKNRGVLSYWHSTIVK